MIEYLQNNQITLRSCILYEFIEGKPVYESFKNMCRKIGDDAIDYVDFEYWYMRFANGNFDLNHDRSLDPKTRTLFDMPVHILDKIMNELDLKYRFVIRRVSKNFQYIIDSWYPKFENITIEFGHDWSYLRSSGKEVANNNDDEEFYDSDDSFEYYVKPNDNDNACIVTYGKRGTLIETKEHAKLAIDDLAVILKNPKLQLDELRVSSSYEKFIPEFELMLKSLNRKIHVNKFYYIANLRDINGVLTILPCLNSETLEEIVLDIEQHENQLDANELSTIIVRLGAFLRPCKKAKMLTLTGNVLSNPFPIESCLHFRRFTIDFRWFIPQKIALSFTKILLKSSVLEVAILKMRRVRIPVFLNQLGRSAIEVPDRPNIRRFPIPKSNEFFEIEVKYDDSICIERRS